MLGNKFQELIINLLVFLIPSQLAIHFWPNYSFIFGIRVDYFAPTIYLTDFLIVYLIFTNFKKLLSYKTILGIIILFAILNTFFSVLPYVTLFKWLKILEYASLAIILKDKNINKPLYYSIIFFSFIGIIQFLIGSTTGFFYLLGERSFNINTPGIALTELFGRIYMRAYSTFPHPNALAGYLGLSTIYLVHKKYKFNLLYISPFLSFVLTFSLSAFISITTYFIFKKYFNKYFVLVFFVLSLSLPFLTFLKQFDVERVNLAMQASKVISQHFWTGVGFGVFPKFSNIRQPVHNLFLLVFSESGIMGFIGIICLLFNKFKKYSFLLFVLVIGLMDHYFLTINQNLLLLFITASLW